MKKNQRKHRETAFSFFAWLSGMLAFLMPGLAAAADFFTPLESDKSINSFLNPLFGSLFGGSSGLPIESAIGVFNGGVLVLGGIIAAYTLITGTMQTAHDGEMLGKKWSSMWVPIRTVLGIGLVVPVAGGYCVAQLFVAWTIHQGVYFADAVWDKYITEFASPKGMAPKPILPSVDTLARAMLQSQLCMDAYNDVNLRSGKTEQMTIDASTTGLIKYGGGGMADNACGTVRYRIVDGFISGSSSGSEIGIESSPYMMDNYTSISSLKNAHITAVQTMSTALKPITAKIIAAVNDGTPAVGISQDLIAAQAAYQQSVAAQADSVFGDGEALAKFIETTKQDGWFSAGMWYMKAAQMQDSVNRAVSDVPVASGFDPQAFDLARASDLDPYFSILKKSLRASSSAVSANMGNAGANDGGNDFGGGEGLDQSIEDIGDSGNPMKTLFEKFTRVLFGGTMQQVFQLDSDRDLIMSLKDTGDYLMTGAEGAIAIGVAAIGAGGAAEGASESFIAKITFIGSVAGASAGAVLMALGWILIMIGVPLFAFAASVSVYLPMLPFLIFFGTFLGWLLLVAEALIAAPIWAVMHLNPNGDEVMGSARQGYMLILSLILRPVLIVFGFILALIAAQPILAAYNMIFFPIFRMSMAGSMVGLFTSIIMIVIYFTSIIYFLHKLFSLTHVIPDKILGWFGGGGGSLGDMSREFDSKGGTMIAAVGGAVSQAPSHLNQARMASAQEKQLANDMVMKGNDMAGATIGTQSKAVEAVSAAKTSGGDPTTSLAAIGRLNEDAQAKYAAADQLDRTASRSGGSMSMEERGAMRDRAAALRSSGLDSQTQAENLVSSLEQAGDSASLAAARDGQNLLDKTPKWDQSSGRMAQTPLSVGGKYSERASQLNTAYEQSKTGNVGQMNLDFGGNASNQTGGGNNPPDHGNRNA